MKEENKVFGYKTVTGDPLNTRIYQLKNGLTVFLSVYPDTPRIQANIAVRAGSKMDPPETTGLAHYFEHMMFKGTENFGTTDWEGESELINGIENLFEEYRAEKDEIRRDNIYRKIDELSYQASLLAIPNEYDKLMDAIGSQGSNAGTSNDYTIFIENIPGNQVENWAWIQAERFTRPVLRLFHTELETVYEEKNMSLSNDNRKVNEVMMQLLFPNHPYGTQTTLGASEHLKNPSMKNIREFFRKYYVPNNIAICMSGDLDPDKTIKIIDKYFGKMNPAPVPSLNFDDRKPAGEAVVKVVNGLEAENLRIGYGFDIKANQDESLMLIMAASMLYNSKAGILDLNLNQPQKVLNSLAYEGQFADYGMLVVSGYPRSGQTLDDIKELLLQQVEMLKLGEFPGWLPAAVLNNARYDLLKQYETNQGRAMAISHAWMNDIPYAGFSATLEKMEKIKKEDIVRFATNHINNPVIIYKKQGTPEEVVKVNKPSITPIHINPDSESAFLRNIKSSKVSAVKPEFLDYSKDLILKHLPDSTRVIICGNSENPTFQLDLLYRMGRNHDKVMNFAIEMIPYLGTEKHTLEEINLEFFRLGCSFSVHSGEEETTLSLTGLSEKMPAALQLVEEILSYPSTTEDVVSNRAANALKSRMDGKGSQNEVFNALISYGLYGPVSPYNNVLSDNEILSLNMSDITGKIKSLSTLRHDVLYYGNTQPDELIDMLSPFHSASHEVKPVPDPMKFSEEDVSQNKVLFAHYDARQAKLQNLIPGGRFEPNLVPVISMFNAYFGDIVFRELREKRALAYTATSRYQEPQDLDKRYFNKGYIATQSDKVMDAFTAFDRLFDDMPASEVSFGVAKHALLNKVSTERIRRMYRIWNFLNAEKLGLEEDIRRDIFENVCEMTLSDLSTFQLKYLKDKPKKYLVLGREEEMDFEALNALGSVKRLTLTELFGF